MLLGMTSVTLSGLSTVDILSLAKRNGLQAMEWGECHVKRGQLSEAEAVRAQTEQVGIRIVAYSTDFDVQSDSEWTFSKVLETAGALGTDTIILSAGKRTTEIETDEALARLAVKAQNLAELAEKRSMKLCFAYRRGSLLEDYIRAGRFIGMVNRSNVYISWQPNRTSSLIYNIFELKMLAPFVYHVYVSYLDASACYTPIIEGKDEWHQYLKVLKAKTDGALLFKDCDIAEFDSECALMREWMEGIYPAGS